MQQTWLVQVLQLSQTHMTTHSKQAQTHTHTYSYTPAINTSTNRNMNSQRRILQPGAGYQPPELLSATPVGCRLCQCGTIIQTRTHTRRQLLALTSDDCPWFRCVSEAENLAQRHAPFHIHDVVWVGSKFNRESRRSCAQSRRDGLATAPLNQAASCKYTARLRWHPFGHVVSQTGSFRLLRKSAEIQRGAARKRVP